MIVGFKKGINFPRVCEKNTFTKGDLEVIREMLLCENLKYKKALSSLLEAYCENLYCSECKGSLRTSSNSGVCQWNDDMAISLPLNDGPLTSYPTNCPIRKLIK